MSESYSLLRLPIEDLDQVVCAVGSRWERLRGKRILLTGGTGFVGKWLLATFLHANRIMGLTARVIVLSRRPEVFLDEFPELRSVNEIEWLACDVRDLEPDSATDCEFAIHAATDVVATSTPMDILETCITGTRRVLDAMTSQDSSRRVLLLSSGAVYGSTPPELDAIPESWAGRQIRCCPRRRTERANESASCSAGLHWPRGRVWKYRLPVAFPLSVLTCQ